MNNTDTLTFSAGVIRELLNTSSDQRRKLEDLSFLLASVAFGFNESVRMKFVIVREIVTTGNRTGLDRILKRFQISL
jgi:hypothetical protein